MKVLVTGASGQLAQAILAAAPAGYACVPLRHSDLDITDGVAVLSRLEELRPDVVINGAAYNLVDKAESDGADAALALNATGVAHLSQATRAVGARLVHFSTDFVFDGHKRTPYQEEDATGPLGIYAASKLCGENIALAGQPGNLVVRVSRLFGPAMLSGASAQAKPAGNFVRLMLRLGRERPSLRVVGDQIGSPGYTPDLAVAVWQLISAGAGGLFQLSNEGEVDFASYTKEIFRQAQVDCAVEEVTSQAYGAPARRPLYSTMSSEKAYRAGVTPLRPWQEALREYLDGLLANELNSA